MSDESFRAELRVWLAANITDEFREKRHMTFQEKVAVRRAWQKKLFEAGWIGIGWPEEYGGRGASLMQEAIYNEEMARAQAPATANVIGLNMVGELNKGWVVAIHTLMHERGSLSLTRIVVLE